MNTIEASLANLALTPFHLYSTVSNCLGLVLAMATRALLAPGSHIPSPRQDALQAHCCGVDRLAMAMAAVAAEAFPFNSHGTFTTEPEMQFDYKRHSPVPCGIITTAPGPVKTSSLTQLSTLATCSTGYATGALALLY